jgi:hypothetical protein
MNQPTLKAPGLTWRHHPRAGWEARWRATHQQIKAGFIPKSRRLWLRHHLPDDTQCKHIVDACIALQNEMLVWARGGIPAPNGFVTGTLDSLVYEYRTDTLASNYHKAEFATRKLYDRHLRHIQAAYGDTPISTITARTLLSWFAGWSENNGTATARMRIAILRALFTYGLNFLDQHGPKTECERLTFVLGKLKFATVQKRTEFLTVEQANAIRAAAPYPSLALAQAFQFECSFRQKDVIGEWVPLAERPVSDVIHRGKKCIMKWIKGIRWEEIDAQFMLVHRTSKRKKVIAIPLLLCPMVVEELSKTGELRRDLFPASGPVIVSEYNSLPWTATEYRRWWRKTARACGIPDTVKNMDTRAGATTEAEFAGVPLDERRAQNAHASGDMTLIYSRGEHERVVKSLKARVAYRMNPPEK